MFLFITALLSVSNLDYSPDPWTIFQKSDSVLSSINSVSYSFNFQGTGALANIIPVLMGEAVLSRSSTADHPLMELHFTEMERPGTIQDLTVPTSYIATEDSLYKIDHSRRIVTAGPANPEFAGIFDFPPASVLMEYTIEHAFADELVADSIAVLAPDTVDGSPCHVFHVFYADQRSESVWYIGMNDFLPHSVERMGYYGERSDPGGQLLTLYRIEPDESLTVTAVIPDGYRHLNSLSLPETGERAPEIFLADTRGMTARISYPADCPTLICFFSSWDSSSLQALGLLKDLQTDHGDQVDVYAISIWENHDPMFRLSTLEINFPVLIFGGEAAFDYRVSTVPSAILVSKDGIVLAATNQLNSESMEAIRAMI